MAVPERKGNSVAYSKILSATFLLFAVSADAKQVSPLLLCQSDGLVREANYVELNLPTGTTAVSGRVTRPKKLNGNYAFQLMLIDGDGPAHATGLVSKSLPLPLGPTVPVFGYWLGFVDNPGMPNQKRKGGADWLVTANEFDVRFEMKHDLGVNVRLTWTVDGEPRNQEVSVAPVKDDFRRLAMRCFNGDFQLSNIRFETRM